MSKQGFEIFAGSPESSVILHVPHSSRTIPAEVRSGIFLDDATLRTELDQVTDTLTDKIAFLAISKLVSRIPRPWLFVNSLSRFVIDPERFPDDREIMNTVGMGAVYEKTASGKRLRAENFDRTQLLNRYFYPYAQGFTELVENILDGTGTALIIDVHSYGAEQHPNAVNHGQRRPAMCIGTDEFHTADWLTEIFRAEFSKLGDCFENEPYAGTYVPLKYYRKDRRVQSIMMETRADTYLESDLRPNSGLDRISTALASVINSIYDSGRPQ